MRIVNVLVPGSITIGKRIADISREANKRLKWFDYYEKVGRNARKTCRHFGISPDTFYCWKRRYRPDNLTTLEERFRRPLIALAERKAVGDSAPVYMYLFTWETDYLDGLFKACHILEIPFVFDNVDDIAITGGRPDKYELVESISKAWVAFARDGNPNHPGIPRWEPYTADNRSTMVFDVPCRTEIDPGREEIDAWEGIDLRR